MRRVFPESGEETTNVLYVAESWMRLHGYRCDHRTVGQLAQLLMDFAHHVNLHRDTEMAASFLQLQLEENQS